MHGSKNVK